MVRMAHAVAKDIPYQKQTKGKTEINILNRIAKA
jgi:hypothetical protein